MAEVSIDIDAMADLLAGLQHARDELPTSARTVTNNLSAVMLPTDDLAERDAVLAAINWLEDSTRDVTRRLAMARMIQASDPGLAVVTLDETYVSDLSDADLDNLVTELAERLQASTNDESPYDSDDVGIDATILGILDQNALDPYFAAALEARVGPQEIDLYLKRVTEDARGLSDQQRVEFAEDYDQFVSLLGWSLGIASHHSPGMAQSYLDYLQHARPGDGGASRLAVVISRGNFSTDFLVSFAEGIGQIESESGMGALHWANTGASGVDFDDTQPGGLRLIEDPMYGVFSAMQSNPEALLAMLDTPGREPLKFGSSEYTVNSTLNSWMMRHTDAHAMEKLFTALQIAHPTAASDHPVHGQNLDSDLASFQDYFQWQIDNAPPWWKETIHAGLDLAGMAPGIGEWADALNASLYTADGRYRDAAISAGAAALGVGSAAVIARMSGRSRAARILEDQQRITQQLQNSLTPSTRQFLDNANLPADTIFLTAGRTGAWNTQLYRANIKPNSTYVVNDRFIYKTDHLGRVTETRGILQPGVPPAERAGYRQQIAGGTDRLPGDHGGHLFARQFGGAGEDINLVAMRSDLNGPGAGQFGELETAWRGHIEAGSTVDVVIEPLYTGTSLRPTELVIEWRLDGVPQDIVTFVN